MTEVDSQSKQNELLANVKFAASAATDEDLVAAAKSGDHPAFVELWTRHSKTAFNMPSQGITPRLWSYGRGTRRQHSTWSIG